MLITRSLLSTPGNQPRMLQKALDSGADALMFDLEDSVPTEDKDRSRSVVRQQIDTGPTTSTIYVRVNSWQSGRLEEDLEAVVASGLRGIVLPKVENPEAVRSADALLDRLERQAGVPARSVDLALALETARGIWFVFDLVSTTPRTRTVLVGTAEGGDLQADLRSSWSPAGPELLFARGRVVTAARACAIDNILDGAYSNFRDQAGLEADSRLSRALGYRGRMLIHPGQVALTNRIYSPTEAELDFSRRVLVALEEAAVDNRAAASVDGVMVDAAMGRRASAMLEEAGWNVISPSRRS